MKTSSTPRFGSCDESTYKPAPELEHLCSNRVRRMYSRQTEPACADPACAGSLGEWNRCGNCTAKPRRPAVVIAGPQGVGKTLHADQLAKRYGCKVIADGWDGHSLVPPGTLALTNLDSDERPIRGDYEVAVDSRQALEALARKGRVRP